MVTPSYMLAIADALERQRVDPRTTSLRLGIFGAEPWTEALRAEIESKLDIDALDYLWTLGSHGSWGCARMY